MAANGNKLRARSSARADHKKSAGSALTRCLLPIQYLRAGSWFLYLFIQRLNELRCQFVQLLRILLYGNASRDGFPGTIRLVL